MSDVLLGAVLITAGLIFQGLVIVVRNGRDAAAQIAYARERDREIRDDWNRDFDYKRDRDALREKAARASFNLSNILSRSTGTAPAEEPKP